MSSTRNKLIKILSEKKGEYISGQELSEKLQVSRSAIWKHMNELKKDGYIIEGVAKKGYRIISAPKTVTENTIMWGLETKWLGKNVIHRDSLESTQTLAHQLALDGAKHGTIVVANEQTKARGRVSRKWYSPKGKIIAMSMILRPDILPYLAPQLTLLTATVLANVLDEHCGIKPQIKWPNDILINGKKVAGILTEMQAEQDKVLYVIIGIGMNINQTESEIAEEIRNRATSLFIETKVEWEIVPIIQKILEQFEKKYDAYLVEGFKDVKETWENYGFKINERLKIKTAKETFEAIFRGIGEDGALLAEKSDGTVEKIYSAEIAWF